VDEEQHRREMQRRVKQADYITCLSILVVVVLLLALTVAMAPTWEMQKQRREMHKHNRRVCIAGAVNVM
jgi:flagellar basal body-associated protein FliL